MGIKIKNLQTGEFEKFNIPALKGEKGEPGEIEPSEKVDYIGKQHSKLRDTMNANVDYIIKTAIGEFNYLDYEGQHITATNSIEGHAKSAILKGQTLVNLVDFKANFVRTTGTVVSREGNKITFTTSTTGKFNLGCKLPMLKPNTKYLLKIKAESSLSAGVSFSVLNVISNIYHIATTAISDKIYFFTTNNVVDDIQLLFNRGVSVGDDTVVGEAVVCEYQQGMENWNIPYFTGMQSVKMPVLHTVGKNLFDGKFELGSVSMDSGQEVVFNGAVRTSYIKVKPNTTYSISRSIGTTVGVRTYNKNKKFVKSISLDSNNATTFTTPNEAEYIRFALIYANNDITVQAQLEEGSNVTSYEPHKSNILSLPEEVVLRSLPNGVRDTFNTGTGVYTQRIGEVVLNGENYTGFSKDSALENDTTCKYFISNFFSKYLNGKGGQNEKVVLNCNYLPPVSFNHMQDKTLSTYPCIANSGAGSLNLRVGKDIDSISLLLAYLQSNPITIQYELATPIIKTVDLSDNHVYSYKGTTHYSCSSEEGSLVPTLSVKVPTDTQLTIQEQKATTQTLLIKNMDLQQSIKEVQAMNLAFNTALYNSFNSIREEVEDIKKHVSTNENLEGSF